MQTERYAEPTSEIIVRTMDGTRYIGRIRQRVLYKSINFQRHTLHTKGNAIAIDAGAYERWRHCFDTIVCKDKQSGLIYKISRGVFEQHRAKFNMGYGDQYRVALKHWTEYNPAQLTLMEV